MSTNHKPDVALNARIAMWMEPLPEKGWKKTTVSPAGWWRKDIGGKWAPNKFPDTDLIATWEVVDRLCPPPNEQPPTNPLGRSFHMSFGGVSRSNCSGRYHAYFSGAINRGNGAFEIYECGMAEADTAPLAICRAALKAIGELT